jgi:hypothetical protein
MEPWRFSHIYVRALVEWGWMGMDASHGSVPGWETRRQVFRRSEWIIR